MLEETRKAGVFRVRRVHAIEYWRRRRTITRSEHEAAERFCLDWHHAQLVPRPAMSSVYRFDCDSGHGDEPEWRIDRRNKAYRSVQAALAAVGPRAREAVEKVVGERQALADFCCGGGSIRQAEVRATLLMALSVLAAHYGYSEGDKTATR